MPVGNDVPEAYDTEPLTTEANLTALWNAPPPVEPPVTMTDVADINVAVCPHNAYGNDATLAQLMLDPDIVPIHTPALGDDPIPPMPNTVPLPSSVMVDNSTATGYAVDDTHVMVLPDIVPK